jgi:hypothetical protein
VNFLNELRAKRDEGVDSPDSPGREAVLPSSSTPAANVASADAQPSATAATSPPATETSAGAEGSERGGRVDA